MNVEADGVGEVGPPFLDGGADFDEGRGFGVRGCAGVVAMLGG